MSEFGTTCTFFPPQSNVKEEMEKFLGIPYRWGGSSPKGMDCSALTREIYSKIFGVDLPRNSVEQSKATALEAVRPSKATLQFGDLIFFGPRKKKINHVGIYLSDGKFLHSSRSSGVIISSLEEDYWKKRLITSRRLKDMDQAAALNTTGVIAPQEALSFGLGDSFDRDTSSLELGYRSMLLDSLHLNLSLDTFMRVSPANLDSRHRLQPIASWEDGYVDTMGFEPRHGFRLLADLSPFEWLRVTPSITQMNEAGPKWDLSGSNQVLGVDTLLEVPESPWSFAFSARAGNKEESFGWPSAQTEDWTSMDISFGLRYRVSEALKFSLTGTREYTGSRDETSADLKWTPSANNLAIKFDLSF